MRDLQLVEFPVVYLAMFSYAYKYLLNAMAEVDTLLNAFAGKKFVRLVLEVSSGLQSLN